MPFRQAGSAWTPPEIRHYDFGLAGPCGFSCRGSFGAGVGFGVGVGVNSSGSGDLTGAPSGGSGGCTLSNSLIGMSGSTFQGGTTTGTFFLSVPTVTCG